MKQWLIEAFADDQKDIQLTEDNIKQICREFRDAIAGQLAGHLDRIETEGEWVRNTANTRLKLDDLTREARYQMQQRTDRLIRETLGQIIERFSKGNDLYQGELELNYNPLNSKALIAKLREIEQGLEQAASDAIGSLEEKVEDIKDHLKGGGRTRKETLTDTIMQGASIFQSATFFMGAQVLWEGDRIIRREQVQRAGMPLMVYRGPHDRVTRDWCELHVNAAAPPQYWIEVQNNVGPNPPIIYGGGYNCRHRLIGVRKEWLTTERIISLSQAQ